MITNNKPDSMLDDSKFFNEIWGRYLQQRERKDYEGKILHKLDNKEISSAEAKILLGNISEKEFIRKLIMYVGTDPHDVEDFEKEYGEPFYNED